MHRLFWSLLFIGACNLSPKPATDDSSGTDSGDSNSNTGGGMTIKEARGGAAFDGDAVTLKGVIVTSPITRDGEGFFVQDPDGGPRSGIYVWYQTGLDPYVVAEGDEITVEGTISEYYDWTELVIFGPDSIQNTGTGTPPAPIDLGDGAGVNWDDYESTVVALSDQTVASVNTYNTGVLASGINLDDGFVFLDFDCGGHFDSLSGIIFYQYEEFSLNPRYEADLGTYTGGPATTTTVATIQQGNGCGTANLENLVATTDSLVADDGSVTFYAQDAGGGDYSGIAIFLPGGGVTIAAGDVVSVVGSASEFYDFTELFVSDATTVIVSGTDTPVPSILSATPTDWEVYEGNLVSLENLDITSDIDQYGQAQTSYGIMIDNGIFDYNTNNGDHFGSVMGVVTYSYGVYMLLPRSEADFIQ
jgi:predicted extracellular nuclease